MTESGCLTRAIAEVADHDVRIGVPEDIVSAAIAKVFGDFAGRHREIQLDVTAGLSRDLTRRYRAGEFDIAIVKEAKAEPDCRATFPEIMAWFERTDAPDAWPNPIPLVAFPPGGLLPRGNVRAHRARAAWLVHRLFRQPPSQCAGRGGGRARPVPSPEERDSRISRSAYAPFGTEPAMAVSIYAWERAGPASELVEQMEAILAARCARRT
ncbi:LysR substrate-binding domain-containing protein [Nitrobacter sp. TKz-YC02]|uniref:LysR substrate-binding domain-containing protein n=1 Tax=Nitrobacter sp. TKz-YC02 TaxID=3398704 RepID=UPI003CF8EB37